MATLKVQSSDYKISSRANVDSGKVSLTYPFLFYIPAISLQQQHCDGNFLVRNFVRAEKYIPIRTHT